MGNLRWRKSSYSVGNPEQCVESTLTTRAIYLRDSKNPAGEMLTITHGQFHSLVESIRTQT
jgi:Domain of unknown function (DUF397)